MDPTPGYGITDALRDAKALAKALIDGRPDALDLYWRERDVLSLPLYNHAQTMGALDYANPFNEMIISRVSQTPALKHRVRAVLYRELSPFEMVPPGRLLAWTAPALLRNPKAIWPHFAASAQRGGALRKQLARSTALLDAVRAKLRDPLPPSPIAPFP
jgi:hypothetical protein